jgi:very-short-patch-repair endonuclease
MSTSIQKLIEISRRELLDFSMRNPLLNYRLPKTRGLSIVNNQPDLVFNSLVNDKKNLGFKQKKSKEFLGLESEQISISEEKILKGSSLKLECIESEAIIQKRLLSTYSTAQSILEEQGVNILFLTMGMLHWLEVDNSEEFRQAPLILIPVKIERKEARDNFVITYSEADYGVNISLRAKLKAEFNIELPEFDDEIDLPLTNYFNIINQLISNNQRWRLEAYKMELGFFSFGKFLIYNDLDDANWPESKKPFNHPIIEGLFGEGFNQTDFPSDDTFIDKHPQNDELFQVVDADSSQVLNLLQVHAGKNLVIQGPPGTGKSQTITNILANAIGQGKKVLFVAEKMAALEVVKRRMDMCGLGEACLELHSHKANKKDLLAELKRVLELGKPQTSHLESELSFLKKRKEDLNAYSEAVNSELLDSGLNFFQIIGRLLQIDEEAVNKKLPILPHEEIQKLNHEQYRSSIELLRGIEQKLNEIGSPRNLAFYGSNLKVVLPQQVEIIKEVSSSLNASFQNILQEFIKTFSFYKLKGPEFWKDADAMLNLLQFIINAPNLDGVMFEEKTWNIEKDKLISIVHSGKRFSEISNSVHPKMNDNVWTPDWTEVKQIFDEHHHKWYHFLIGNYRKAKKLILTFSNSIQKPSKTELPILLDAIIEGQNELKNISRNTSFASKLFGKKWLNGKSDFNELDVINKFLISYHSFEFPEAAASLLLSDKKIALDKKIVLESLLSKFNEIYNQWKDLISFDESVAGTLKEKKTLDIQYWFSDLSNSIEDLALVCQWNISLDLIKEKQVHFIINPCLNWQKNQSALVLSFEKTYLENLYEYALNNSAELSRFERSRHEELIKKFKEEDQLNFQFNRAKASLKHFDSLPNPQAGGQMMVLRTEMNKKIRHLPLRKLVESAGLAIQDIKPVFMMSPMSIATFIPPGMLEFDLVVFDEASQVKPVDALGAILRGKQLVVVGDSKQLPPTNFFETISDDIDEEENVTQDIESILGLADAKGIGGGMLRWHYRSKHESLIKVSNFEFYDNRLVVFPSANKHDKLGLKLNYYPNTFYDRGQTRTNKMEAALVMEAVLSHVKNYPNLSLGIVSFSNAQKQCLEDLFEESRKENPDLEDFIQDHIDEPFFIKNLENVQGDERDVILISVGYGKTKEGYLAMNFGPLNGVGGERRLNVLITRARQCCEVFTNIKADDIDVSKSQSLGVKALKSFLYYAETGNLNMSNETGRQADSLFEVHVADKLRAAGYDIAHQIGSNGFFIDLAVRDENGNYILGIECDGRMYHSARSARDRDRLRQQVLEAMGWKIHRIWSTDWFTNRDRELKRTIEVIERAKIDKKGSQTIFETKVKQVPIVREPAKNDKHLKNEYVLAILSISLNDHEFHQTPIAEVASWLKQIVDIEAPVHLDDAGKRIIEALGITRLGSRIKTHLDDAASFANNKGLFIKKDNFLFHIGNDEIQIRDRSNLSSSARKTEWISQEEVFNAITKVVSEAYQIQDEETIVLVSNMLGFSRLTEDIRTDFSEFLQLWKVARNN